MASFSEYEQFDGLGLAELVKNKDVTPAELLEAATQKADEVNPEINAITQRFDDLAEKSISDGLPDGAFAGVPFLLKDLHVLLTGTTTTSGSRLYKDHVATHNSTLVDRYIKAGFVTFGKTNSPEFGLTVTTEPQLFGPTRNPWNKEHSPGGSSGGAASAVAAGIVPIAHASDGGGSVRLPASACGLFGLKPTRGRIPAGPDRGEGWHGCSINNVISRSVRDSAAVLDATAGSEPGEPYSAPHHEGTFLSRLNGSAGPLRIAFSTKSPIETEVHPDCIAAVEHAARLCTELGHDIEEAQVPLDGPQMAQTLGTVIGVDIASRFEQWGAQRGRPVQPDEVEFMTWRTAENGSNVTGVELLQATQSMHEGSRRMAHFFEKYDVLIEPTFGQPPVKLGTINTMDEDIGRYMGRLMEASPFTGRYNLTGLPSMNVPLYWNDAGLPIGVMFTGPFGNDARLLQLARQLEEAQPWFDNRPK